MPIFAWKFLLVSLIFLKRSLVFLILLFSSICWLFLFLSFILDSVLRSRDITVLTKVQVVKAVMFPVDMYGCESWIVKKAKHWRIDAFKLWCWRSLLRVPCTAGIANQSVVKEINPEFFWKDWCWSQSSNTLATWCEELTYLKRPWCWGRLMADGEGDDRGWDGWMASLTR